MYCINIYIMKTMNELMPFMSIKIQLIAVNQQ